MRDVTSTGPTPSRRLVTAGAIGAAIAVLTGCGIRLEDDAPRVPLVPTRSPIEGEGALLRLLAALQAAGLATVDPKAPISALLAPLHQRQATVLHDALRQRGVPQDELPSATPSPSTSTSPTPVPSTSGTPSPAPSSSAVPVAPGTVATVEGSIITAGAGTSAAEKELRPTLLAVLGQAHAALELATGKPSAAPAPAPTWSAPQALAPLIATARAAGYFLEVAAARSPQAARKAALESIASLDRLTAELVAAAGDAAPVPELGQPLPHPVTTPAEAKALATQAMTMLLSSFGSNLRGLSDTDADADATFAMVPRWMGTVAAQAHRHGIPLTAFPGLA
ncbi:hypothetical protein V6K52_12975 [Knoellia sp. S7-12]|uniref:hypothetical protein n=1 Tax=Knoellia sp. S7-12 TaxID=3126698 RepID=UPI00336944CE